MKKKIFPLLLCVCLLASALSLGTLAAGTEEYTAEFTMAYGGAKGILSMTFDDGDYDTNVWLDQMFEKYDLYGSTMAIVQGNYEKNVNGVYEMDPVKVSKWADLFAKGRLQPESHTYTHIVLPNDNWASHNGEEHLANNTEANYHQQLVVSKQLIKAYLGYDTVCLAPSNNTLSDGAMAVVKQTYYAVRQGDRFQNVNQIQSLDPVPGSSAMGGWYNLAMAAFYDSNHNGINVTIPNAVDHVSKNGGWVVTMCHGIRENSGDATYAEAEAAFQKFSEYQKAGTVWVTTFGNATKYIRERQNSTISYSYTAEGVTLQVTMADKTADNLPLDEKIFNQPLTVKIQLGSGVDKVAYSLNGVKRSATTFTENGKTYAYVDVVPNSGVIEIERISENGLFTVDDLAKALDEGGSYRLAGNVSVGKNVDLTVNAENVEIDLAGNTITFVDENTITVPEGKNVTFRNGNVVVASSYATSANKSFRKYKPITQNADGTYTLGGVADVPVSDLIAEADRKQTSSHPAFTVAGGKLVLNGISLERAVAVSNGGELLRATAGEVYMKNSKLFDSVGVMSWANATTRLISLVRQATPTKLTVEGSHIYMAKPNSYYNGTLIAESGPSAIDATTGEVTSEGHLLDSSDDIKICYVEGATDNTGVQIVITDSIIQTMHRGFLSETNYNSTDTLTMTDSRMSVTRLSNYQSRSFEFYSADLVFENCYMNLSDNAFTMNNDQNPIATTSLTMKQCYVSANHVLRFPSNTNQIYFEDTFISGGMLRWIGYNKADATTLPTIQIAGDFYTTTTISETVPVHGQGDWTGGSTANFWFNLQKVDGNAAIHSGTPAWNVTVKHADGTREILTTDNATKTALSSTDTLYLWNRSVTNTVVTLTGTVNVNTYGIESHFIVYGGGQLNPIGGNLGQISIIRNDGSIIYHINNTSKTLENTFPNLTTGQTIVLQADQQLIAALIVKTNQKVSIDLNGYTVYHAAYTDKLDRLQPIVGLSRADEACYIYSSRPGARILNGYNHRVENGADKYNENRGGTVFELSNGLIAIGYGADGKARGEKINVVSGQMINISSGTLLANNVDWYVVSGDNSTFTVFYKNAGTKTMVLTGCNIYARQFNRVFAYREITTATVNLTLDSTNVYSTSNARVLLQEHSPGVLKVEQNVTLRNCGLYNLKLVNTSQANIDKFNVTVDGECYLYEGLSANLTIAPGNYIEKKSGNGVVEGTSYPNGSLYGDKENTNCDGRYVYNYVVKSASAYEKTLYTNVTLDTALDLNLYIPVDATISSVSANGEELLDTTKLQTIGEKEYYVVTVSDAPKNAYKNVEILITTTSGRVYKLAHSLVNYAENLFAIDESKVTNKAYLADSKDMMLYVLNYAKEVITKYGDASADLTKINALLDGFALTDADKTLENVKENLPTLTGVSGAFDLDSKVGLALGIANTFTGKVTVTVGDTTVNGEYTGDATANGDIVDALVVPNILAYQLYAMDITVTVVGENAGTAVNTTFTYNLATYVSSGVSGNVGTALYAYAKAAKTYGAKYKVGTID